jgi:endonuclease/exonuclease/phosphatase family metal-dependent hydrolase
VVPGQALATLTRGLAWHPPPELAVEVERTGRAEHLQPGSTVTVLVWNLQFCGSRRHHFFYDGGDADAVATSDVREMLDAVGDVIADTDPDLLLLQEVDRGSDRTHRIDELDALVALTPYARVAATPYHCVRYVPHPPGDHLGRVDMQLAVLARAETRAARRIQLPLLRESWLRRQFNLRRAILEVELSRGADRPPLVVMDTHLSAFSRGDGTLSDQADMLLDRIATHDAAGSPWLLGGDLNMLPPQDDPTRLGKDAALYGDERNPITRLFDAGHRCALPVESRPHYPGDVGTYLPHGSERADRTLDYLFVSPGIEVLSARVLSEHTRISDHLPVLVELRVP